MKPRDIIARSWALTKTEKTIRKWAFSHSILSTLFNAKLFFYQAWLAYSYFVLNDPIGFVTIEKMLWENLPPWLSITIFVLFGLLLLAEWLFPHMARGAIVGLGAKAYQKEEVKGGLVLAIYNFFPLFALHEVLVLSSFTTTITLCSLCLRYGGDVGMLAAIILGVLWFISNVLEFFWIFSEEAVVISKMGIREAIKQSFKLVISYLSHIVFLILLLFIIILRIVANLLMIILVPAIVLGFGWFLSTLLPAAISYTISTIVGLTIIGFASYLFAYLEVFRQTVWTITYIELSKMRDLDVIEIE